MTVQISKLKKAVSCSQKWGEMSLEVNNLLSNFYSVLLSSFRHYKDTFALFDVKDFLIASTLQIYVALYNIGLARNLPLCHRCRRYVATC